MKVGENGAWFAKPMVGGLNRPPAGGKEAAPSDGFVQSQATPPVLGPTQAKAVPAATPTEGQKKSIGAGKRLGHSVASVLGAGLLAVGLLAGGVATHDALVDKTPPPQVQMSQRDADRAGDNLNYLDQIGHASGGGLKTDAHLWKDKIFNHQPDVNPHQAFAAMVGGQTVYFYPGADAQPIPMHSADELRAVTREVKSEVTKAQFQQGAKAIGEGLRNVGERIQDGLNDIFHR